MSRSSTTPDIWDNMVGVTAPLLTDPFGLVPTGWCPPMGDTLDRLIGIVSREFQALRLFFQFNVDVRRQIASADASS